MRGILGIGRAGAFSEVTGGRPPSFSAEKTRPGASERKKRCLPFPDRVSHANTFERFYVFSYQGITMGTIYEITVRDNLRQLYDNLSENLEESLRALRKADTFTFTAFGETCVIEPDRITFSGKPDYGPRGILVSLYASHANPEPLKLEPFRAFKDFPGSMPYHGAFRTRSELVLVPHAGRIQESSDLILAPFDGKPNPAGAAGDFSLLLYPLPKIALCYIFYLPDEDFPASVTCLFSANALSFMPLDGLADVAEHSSEKMLTILEKTGP